MIRNALGFAAVALVALSSAGDVRAQSLSAKSPAPLHAGTNEDRTDTFTGAHYWYFYGGPGAVTVRLRYKGDDVLGVPLKTAATFTLSDAAQSWHSTTKLTSANGAASDYTFNGNVKTRTKIVVGIDPGKNGLVREGGTYDVTVTGAVGYGKVALSDPIVGTYAQSAAASGNIGVTKFRPDGTIDSATGATGTWKLFDETTHAYAVTIDDQKLSLVLRHGVGLVDSADQSTVLFKVLQ